MYIFIILLLIKISYLIIIIPFQTQVPLLDIEDTHFDYLLENEIYSTIEIGNPPQKVNLFYHSQEYNFYLSKYNASNFYDIDKSFSYILIKQVTFINAPFLHGSISSDNFYFTNEKNKTNKVKIQFIYASDFKDESYDFTPKTGIIGLKFYDPTDQKHSHFIKSLKESEIIDSYVWSIKYDDNDDKRGNIIIGGNPHEIEPKIYNKENLKWTKSEINRYFIDWYILFDQIYFGEKLTDDKNDLFNFNNSYNSNNSEIRLCHLVIENGLIKGTKDYRNLFVQTFGNECKETNEQGLLFYSCKLTTNIEKLPSIYFIHRELNYTFFLDYKDLFKKELGQYYFLVYFFDRGEDSWTLGKPFLKKYHMLFDHDKRMIGFYNGYNKKSYFVEILIVIFVIIILMLGIYGYQLFKKKFRKRRANEIEDYYEYSPAVNE